MSTGQDNAAADAPPADWLSPIRTALLWALTVEVAVLVVTGVALFFIYRPSYDGGWQQVFGGAPGDSSFPDVVRWLHRWASAVAVPTALAFGVLLVVDAWTAARKWRAASGIAAGLSLSVMAASASGFLLPWDQLALWAVKVGTNMRGYRPMFGEDVRFVLIGGVEVTTGTVVRWLLVHMLVLGPAVVALVTVAWRRVCRARPLG
ncbi:MAG TPA: cytochrome b N-terminal domain-containing protein [Acidimicrobiales bacterium]|nr:cytochrome b N-terminal domain-containing protein [Acidimicrobiales bacterium]